MYEPCVARPVLLTAYATVTFNRRIRPRCLEHGLATITELDPRWVTVRLARHVGRFRDGELRGPPLPLRRLGRPRRPVDA